MNLIDWVIQTAIILVLYIFHLLLNRFLSSYFTKKGQNLAKKQDIQELTEKVEAIKTEHSASIETLRTGLHLHSESEKANSVLARTAIMSFFEDASNLIFDHLYKNDFGDTPSAEMSITLNHFRAETENLINSLIKGYHKLILFFPDEESLISAAENFLAELRETRNSFRKSFPQFSYALKQEAVHLLENVDFDDTLAEKREWASKNYYDIMEPQIERLKVAFYIYVRSVAQLLKLPQIEMAINFYKNR